ncbi:MAG: peptidylprolyl isomerase [Alistipes sp.]|jgi:peptidyl-prolyl cis-trans isomerase SurA|nr:peptidylprolyl isomerase [Alistipes sp.]
MKRNIIILFAALGVSLSAAGQQQFIADKVVSVVGSLPILYSDVVAQARTITEHYRSQNYTSPRDPMAEALEMLLEQKLLFQRAQIDSIGLENLLPRIMQSVESSVDGMIAEAGSIKALETAQHKPLYSIKDDLRDEMEQYYGAEEMRTYLGNQVKVTPGEVDRYYRGMDPDSLPIVPEQYVYAQITRLPKSSELAKQRTRERLLDLRQRIIDGERFDRLAVMYSVDPGTAMRGGEMDPSPRESFVEPFGDALSKLQPGQVSGVVETEFGFHIIQLIDKPSDNLYHFRHILLKPTYTTEEQAETLAFLDSLATVVRRGDITFADAALRHSDDKASRMNGGVVSNQQLLYRYTGDSNPKSTRTRFIKDALEQNDAAQLVRLGEGEISKAFIGMDFNQDEVGKMLRLVEIVPAHRANLSEDWLDIEKLALARKQDTYYREWLDGKIDEMYVRIDPMFTSDDFRVKRWFK